MAYSASTIALAIVTFLKIIELNLRLRFRVHASFAIRLLYHVKCVISMR